MSKLDTSSPITAILYSEGRDVDPVMLRIAALLQASGCSLAGFVQRNAARPGRRRCDMVLEDLASGAEIAISEDRGAMARGCHLDVGELLRGAALGRQALDAGADLLIVNKFGKSEGEGGGFRPLVADAMMRGTPVLIAVPWRNIDSWRLFAGEFCREIQLSDLPQADDHLMEALGFELSEPRGSIAPHQPGRTAHDQA